ncbi:hypothetical protein JCM1840_006574 [Sporobolomyces johnsonii]
MGACGSSEAGAGQGALMEEANSRLIDKMLRDEERRLGKEVKTFELILLVLAGLALAGPGSSGKSTILVIHLSGFTQGETESYRQAIFVNVRDAMKACFAVMDEEGIDFSDFSLMAFREVVELAPDLRDGEPFPADLLMPLATLWNDRGLRMAITRGNEATLPENMPYFYAELDRLFSPQYRPSDQDILRCRQKTTGITETTFRSRDMEYRIFDVGGQRSERKKWIHCFETVTAVLFLAAISGYDQVLLEDRESNQMQEALMLFDSICNSQWFVKTSIILFLNKCDVFEERILLSSIKLHFPDYQGEDSDYNAGREYFKARFTRLNRSTSKEVYCNYTTAIDTNLVKVVMASVYDIILARNLQDIIL